MSVQSVAMAMLHVRRERCAQWTGVWVAMQLAQTRCPDTLGGFPHSSHDRRSAPSVRSARHEGRNRRFRKPCNNVVGAPPSIMTAVSPGKPGKASIERVSYRHREEPPVWIMTLIRVTADGLSFSSGTSVPTGSSRRRRKRDWIGSDQGYKVISFRNVRKSGPFIARVMPIT